ncbi:MAG: TetR/AcrR family transcriptional regulator C-terminal domain-containing protein [Thermoleophilaceae bacterium]|nr:TetR/AcrR family transcriptional regulator C-terminal domain-containing protein [Thermoleophilaceae bacterium]
MLSAAVELADHLGFEALTMRKLAEELGVGAMSLYYYVPNKDELLDGMVEIVFAEIEVPADTADWKAAMRHRANSGRAALARHRWANGLMESRTRPGPESLRLHNDVLGVLREAGFSIELAIHANSVLDAYIYGFALQEASVPFDTPDELADVIGEQVRHVEADKDMTAFAEAFPHLAEIVVGHIAHSGFDFGEEFEYGLALILDGLEQRLTRDQ